MSLVTVNLSVHELAALAVICEQSGLRTYQSLGARLRSRLYAENVKRLAAERMQDRANDVTQSRQSVR